MMEGKRNNSLFLYRPRETQELCHHLAASAQSCGVTCKRKGPDIISRFNHSILWLGRGAPGTEDLTGSDPSVWEGGLSSTGTSLWVSLPGAQEWPPKMCGADQEAELGTEVQRNWGAGQNVGWEFLFGVNTIFYGFGNCFTEIGY